MRDAMRAAIVTVAAPLKRVWQRRRVGRLVVEHVEGIPVVVLPDVFNPAVFRSSAVMIRGLRRRAATVPVADTDVLDLGTGTGVCGLAAAALDARVIAADINPMAVRNARINTLVAGMDERMSAVQSDLFDGLPDTRFDWILFNPPFFPGQPRNLRDFAWRSTGLFERFGREVPRWLAPQGRVLMVLSNHIDERDALQPVEAAGLAIRVLFSEDLGNEVFSLYELTHKGPGRP